MKHILEPIDRDRCSTKTSTPGYHAIRRALSTVDEILDARKSGYLDAGLQPKQSPIHMENGWPDRSTSGKTQAAIAKGLGAIFTRREVVSFILDLAGYTSDKPLHTMRALEPSFGRGDFLIAMIERCLNAWESAGRPGLRSTLAKAIVAVELHDDTFARTRHKVIDILHRDVVSAPLSDFMLDT